MNKILEEPSLIELEKLEKNNDLGILTNKKNINKNDNLYDPDIRELKELEEEKNLDNLTDEEIIDEFNSSSDVIDIVNLYFDDINRCKRYSPEEVLEFLKEYKTANPERKKELRDKIVESNLKLVLFVVGRYARPTTSLELLDYVQEGNLGLIETIERFDPDRQCKFSTYATWWIRHHIVREFEKHATTIDVPVYVRQGTLKYNRFLTVYYQAHGYYPTKEEIIEELNISESTYNLIVDFEKTKKDLTSLHRPLNVDGNEEDELIYFIRSDTNQYENFHNDLTTFSLFYEIKKILEPRAYEIIYYRYLLNERWTLEDVSELFGVTRERIRQIEEKALRKIKYLIKTRGIYDNYEVTKEDLEPLHFKKIFILNLLKSIATEEEYEILYYCWYKKDIKNLQENRTEEEIDTLFNNIKEKYKMYLFDKMYYKEIIEEYLSNHSYKEVYKFDITPSSKKETESNEKTLKKES